MNWQNRSAVLETGYARFQRKNHSIYNGEITKKTTKGFFRSVRKLCTKDGKKGNAPSPDDCRKNHKGKACFLKQQRRFRSTRSAVSILLPVRTVQLHDLQPDTICTLAEEALFPELLLPWAEAVISPPMSCVLLFPVWNQANILMCCPMQRLPENIL